MTETGLNELTRRQLAVLQASVLVVALCGIAYELIIATVSSYLLGNSVYQFSITIGLFMFAMGLGSYLTKRMSRSLITSFVFVEVAISLLGGLSSTLLFLVFPYRVFYEPLMYTLILLIGALVGLEIPILTRVLSHTDSLRRSIAHVLSLDYLGALIGSVSFPLLLLPFLGLFRSSFCIGLLNVAIAALNVIVFARTLKRPRLLGLATAGTGVMLVAGMLFGTAVASFAESRLFVDLIIHREQTPYQRIIVTRNELNGRVRLFLDGHLQFAEQDEYRYHESLVHPVLSLPGSRRQVLILGGGDGMAAREALKYDDVERIDLVDIDPAMTTLCRTLEPIRRINNGALDDPRVQILNLDAFNYVRDTEVIYDRVIADLPDPHNEVLSKLYSVEFYRLVKRRLAPDGFFVTQSASPFVTREVFWSIGATIRSAGLATYGYQITVPSFGIWGFTLASADQPIPERFEIRDQEIGTRFLTTEIMNQAGAFAKDDGPIAGTVSSLFEPKLYHLYLKGLLR